MFSSFIAGLFQQRPDIIIGTSPQFFTVCSAWMLSVFKRRPFVFELRDLWPASIKAVGAMQDSRLLRALEKLELFLYRQAAAIISVTHAFKRELIERGIDGDKISVVVNGVDLERYRVQEKDPQMLQQFQLPNRFVVGYVGTHGMAHALHRILETADYLRQHEAIVFLLVGSGAQRSALLQQAQDMGLPNVRFVESQPKEKMPQVWSLCDVSLIQLKDDPLFRSVIPSKIFESMGMGLPIILSLPAGEASAIIEDCACGLIVSPEQPEQLAAAVMDLYRNPHKRQTFSQAAGSAAKQYSRVRQAEKMLLALQKLTAAN
ncbi:MAG: glycosyltransferase family 4 protein [gamma proteobacterium symbiont of Bathyaustriella thionipta]|nr:glycosyltransferase family 4 protein [gamma proteobacterium symbiont of Bathyaustriella thionipta]